MNVTLRISGTVIAPRDPEVWDAFDVLKWLFFHSVNHHSRRGWNNQWDGGWSKNGGINHARLTHQMHVAASHPRVIAPSHSPNTDGIHISESTHVQLKDATIGTGVTVYP